MSLKGQFWDGPIICIMYTNDMVYSCPDKAVDLYADDSTLHKSVEYKRYTQKITKWLKSHK